MKIATEGTNVVSLRDVPDAMVFGCRGNYYLKVNITRFPCNKSCLCVDLYNGGTERIPVTEKVVTYPNAELRLNTNKPSSS